MASEMLQRLPFDPGYLVLGAAGLSLVLLIVCCVMFIRTRSLKRRIDKLTAGRNGGDLEEIIRATAEDVRALRSEDAANKEAIRALNRGTLRAFQSRGLVRYNAFPGMGGESSFALALLDRGLDGFVLNCIHSREGSYLYVKEVRRGEATVLLGKEEEQALKAAKSKN
ncbi:MAG: DUF4446 family protein [Lachnospiraceae bacterium]|nr:DUF4446 family protein [Lachnospiraceae bacterium]